jgi:hypothetical protein
MRWEGDQAVTGIAQGARLLPANQEDVAKSALTAPTHGDVENGQVKRGFFLRSTPDRRSLPDRRSGI